MEDLLDTVASHGSRAAEGDDAETPPAVADGVSSADGSPGAGRLAARSDVAPASGLID
jgi:hypothetical protein